MITPYTRGRLSVISSASLRAAGSASRRSRTEKAAGSVAGSASYLEAVFATVSGILGPTHSESYVLVHEVPAAAYGFGGKTQEFRFISGQMQTAATAA